MGLLDAPPTRNPGEMYGVDDAGAPAGLNVLLDYAEDTSGVTAPLVNGVGVFPLGCMISVPATSRLVVIEAAMYFQVTAAGNGALLASIWETTSGTPTFLEADGPSGAFLAGTWSAFQGARITMQLGPTTTERQFAVAALLERDTSSVLAGTLRSQSGGHPRTWIRAVAPA